VDALAIISAPPPRGSKTSPAIRAVRCLLPEVSVQVSPTLAPVSARKAVFTSTSPVPEYQCPLIMA